MCLSINATNEIEAVVSWLVTNRYVFSTMKVWKEYVARTGDFATPQSYICRYVTTTYDRLHSCWSIGDGVSTLYSKVIVVSQHDFDSINGIIFFPLNRADEAIELAFHLCRSGAPD